MVTTFNIDLDIIKSSERNLGVLESKFLGRFATPGYSVLSLGDSVDQDHPGVTCLAWGVHLLLDMECH